MSDYLCEELIVDIFTRLSSKSLIRFKSLSKSLCSFISSPDFIQMHTFRSPQKILFRHGNRNQEADIYTLHGYDQLPLCPNCGYNGITTVQFPPVTPCRIVGSCNGTFCLRIKNSLVLWNPSIRRKLPVPECPRRPEIRFWEGIGFGFDPISDDYKIVWISNSRKSSFVYATKTGDWRVIASPTPLFTCVQFDGFFLSGVLYWEVHCHEDLDLSGTGILTFDLSTHVFGLIPLPGRTWHWRTHGITTIHDSLALISYRVGVHDSWIWVWRDASWSVVFKLGTSKLMIWNALQLANSGDILLEILNEGVQVYNPKIPVLSRLVNFNAASSLINFIRYGESLHLLDIGTAWEAN